MNKYRIAGRIKECEYDISQGGKYNFVFIPDSEFVSTFKDDNTLYVVLQPIPSNQAGLVFKYDKYIKITLGFIIPIGTHIICEIEKICNQSNADSIIELLGEKFKLSKVTMR